VLSHLVATATGAVKGDTGRFINGAAGICDATYASPQSSEPESIGHHITGRASPLTIPASFR
jgi:hypothetical protein